jgi:NAD(P)-dependent dehydrogenase (short-subunit alcohol dehydrogenase family)
MSALGRPVALVTGSTRGIGAGIALLTQDVAGGAVLV